MGLWMPLSRAHGKTPREPWQYGDMALKEVKNGLTSDIDLCHIFITQPARVISLVFQWFVRLWWNIRKIQSQRYRICLICLVMHCLFHPDLTEMNMNCIFRKAGGRILKVRSIACACTTMETGRSWIYDISKKMLISYCAQNRCIRMWKMDKKKKAEIIRTDLTKEIYLCYIQLQL